MKTITTHGDGKNYVMQVKGDFYRLRDDTVFAVKDGVLVPTRMSGGTDLAKTNVYVADYLVASDTVITVGAMDRYRRQIFCG